MYDYSVNPKYSVLYRSENIFKSDYESKIERLNNEKLNPKITFNLARGASSLVPEHFIIIAKDPNNKDKGKILKFGENFTVNLYDIAIYFYYRCKGVTKNGTCIMHDEEKEILNIYNFILNYTGTKIDHQNENPLTTEFMQQDIFLNINKNMLNGILKWKTVIYSEKKGITRFFDYLMGISNEIYGGFFIDLEPHIIEKPESEMEKNGFIYLGFVEVFKNENNNYFDYYTRTKKGIFDPISSIYSLCLMIYKLFTLAFSAFYSKNYDNYKMVKKILSRNIKLFNKFEKNKETLDISDISDKKDALLDINSNNSEENIINSEKEEKEEENDKEVKNNDKDNNNNEENNEDSIIIPKLHFYDFIFNNIYIRKCCSSNRQKFIYACNKIIKKYNSADNIIYQLMILENLIKDYKWNNPKLKDIQNNEMVIDLKLLSQ